MAQFRAGSKIGCDSATVILRLVFRVKSILSPSNCEIYFFGTGRRGVIKNLINYSKSATWNLNIWIFVVVSVLPVSNLTRLLRPKSRLNQKSDAIIEINFWNISPVSVVYQHFLICNSSKVCDMFSPLPFSFLTERIFFTGKQSRPSDLNILIWPALIWFRFRNYCITTTPLPRRLSGGYITEKFRGRHRSQFARLIDR